MQLDGHFTEVIFLLKVNLGFVLILLRLLQSGELNSKDIIYASI